MKVRDLRAFLAPLDASLDLTGDVDELVDLDPNELIDLSTIRGARAIVGLVDACAVTIAGASTPENYRLTRGLRDAMEELIAVVGGFDELEALARELAEREFPIQ